MGREYKLRQKKQAAGEKQATAASDPDPRYRQRGRQQTVLHRQAKPACDSLEMETGSSPKAAAVDPDPRYRQRGRQQTILHRQAKPACESLEMETGSPKEAAVALPVQPESIEKEIDETGDEEYGDDEYDEDDGEGPEKAAGAEGADDSHHTAADYDSSFEGDQEAGAAAPGAVLPAQSAAAANET